MVTKPPKPPTILDVARAAYASVSAVSRALSGKPGVSTATRARIRKAARQLGFRPQIAARLLKGQRPPIIAVFSHFQFSWPGTQMLWALSQELQSKGFHLTLNPFQDLVTSESWMDKVLDQGLLGGMVVLGQVFEGAPALAAARERHIPIVSVEFDLPGAHVLGVDNHRGGLLAAQRLAAAASRFVVLSCAGQGPVGADRVRGFTDGLKELGIRKSLIREVHIHRADLAEGIRVAKSLKLSAKTRLGVFSAWGDVPALGILKNWLSRGFVPKRDFALVGYDDVLFLDYNLPGLTTIHQPLDEIGGTAGRWVAQAFAGKLKKLRRKTFLPSLVIRDTA